MVGKLCMGWELGKYWSSLLISLGLQFDPRTDIKIDCKATKKENFVLWAQPTQGEFFF